MQYKHDHECDTEYREQVPYTEIECESTDNEQLDAVEKQVEKLIWVQCMTHEHLVSPPESRDLNAPAANWKA